MTMTLSPFFAKLPVAAIRSNDQHRSKELYMSQRLHLRLTGTSTLSSSAYLQLGR